MQKFAILSSPPSTGGGRASSPILPVSMAVDGVTQIRVRGDDNGPSGAVLPSWRISKELRNTISLPSRLAFEPRDSGSNVTI
jgi:hypothetical protein